MCGCVSKLYQSITIRTGMGKKPTELWLEAIDEQVGRLEVMDEEVQSVKSKMQRKFDSVHESLERIPTVERGTDVVVVKLDQLLSQGGEGSRNVWTSLGRRKHAMEESAKDLKSAGIRVEPVENHRIFLTSLIYSLPFLYNIFPSFLYLIYFIFMSS